MSSENIPEYKRAEAVKDDANKVYDAMRAICHDMPHPVSAPTVYSLTGNLKLAAGYMLQEALVSMASGLERSLIDLDNYSTDDSDPAAAVAEAIGYLKKAATLAGHIGNELSSAQTAINRVGYREPGDPSYREPEDRK
jgi:hypothetical protein